MNSARPLRILLSVYLGPGHINSSLHLAAFLRDRGHHVTYLGLPPAREQVVRSGFEFVPLAEGLLPVPPPPGSPKLPWWRRRFAAERLFRAFVSHCSNGELDRTIRSCRPDLVICDTLIWYVAFRSLSLGIPTANLSTFLAGPPNPHVPPVTSARIPRASLWGRLQIRAAWLWMSCSFFVTRTLAPYIFGNYRNPGRIHVLFHSFLRLARHAGIPCRKNHTYWRGFAGPQLILPEVVLCPRSFEFPQSPAAGRLYLAPTINEHRPEDTSALTRLDRRKPLVFCSLGSESHLCWRAPRFFRTVAAASRLQPDWQWVLSVGPKGDPARCGEPGPNLLVLNWAPQYALLRDAAVMVTHGGLNSILECIHFGVPMVVVPGMRDQPGNMARAIHHGIALGANMGTLTPQQLVKLIAQAMHSPALRPALARMKNAIAAENGLPAAMELYESVAARPAGMPQ